MLVCGIDIGTTNLKVALFDGEGRLRWIRSEPTPRGQDAFGPVTDALSLVRRIEALMEAGWHDLGARAPIAAVSAAGVGEDGLYVGADMEPLGPVIPWFDTRAAQEASDLAASRFATPRAGIAMEPTRTASKWLWTARNRPQQIRAASRWLALTDYVLARWSGVPFMSDTLASRTGCFDAARRQWIGPLLEASAAPPLSPVLAAGTIVGPMRRPGTLRSGVVGPDTLLVVGGHDHPVAAHAIYRLASDARVNSMGTANVIYGEAAPFEVTAYDPLISFMASIKGPGRIACLGVFEFTAAVSRFPGGMAAIRRVLALPEIPGDPTTTPHPPLRSERHLLEWATLNARRMMERLGGYGVPEGPIFATGGWSRSPALIALRASIFGAPVHAPEEKELSVLGAALLALDALGQPAEPRTRVAVIEPKKDWQARYAELYAAFVADVPSSDGEPDRT